MMCEHNHNISQPMAVFIPHPDPVHPRNRRSIHGFRLRIAAHPRILRFLHEAKSLNGPYSNDRSDFKSKK